MRHGPCERPLKPHEDPTDCPENRAAYPWVMAAAILGSSIAFIDGTIVSIALPAIRTDLGASLEEMQWIVNSYALILAAFLLPGGAAGDVFGRSRIFLLGVAIYTVTSLWAGLAGSTEALITARTLEGFGAALMVPASLALITDHVPKERRGAAIGLWSAASAATTALGPVLGGLLVDMAGWRPALLLTVPFGVLTFIVAWIGVPKSAPGGGRMDWTGGLLVCAGLGGLAIWLTNASAGAAGQGAWLGLLGLALLAGFVLHQSRAKAPMMPLGLFRNAPFSVANLQTFLLYGALSGALTYLPVVLIDAFGYSATLAGTAMLPFALIIAVLSRVAGGAMDRFGARPMLVAGPALTAAGFAAMVWIARDGGFTTSVLPAMAIAGLGMGITVTPLSTTVMNSVPQDRAGTASGVNNALSRAAGLIGVPVFGLVGQAGFRSVAGEGTFGEPGSVALGYADAMAQALIWIAVAAAALALASALVARTGLGGAEPRADPA